MAVLDGGSTPFKMAVQTIALEEGGATSITLTLVQGTLTWTETGRAYVEARSNGRHLATPVVVETEDGNVTGSFTCLVSSYLGSSNTHPYEMLTQTGNASAYTSTATGAAYCLKLTFTETSAVDSGGSQTVTFAYCKIDSVEIGEQDGLRMLTCSFTDLENGPTLA